jgi:predicted dehydrogenase
VALAAATGHGLAIWEQYDAPPSTPLDIRLGLTRAEDINHRLRWGFVSASAIGSDWIKSLQDVRPSCPVEPFHSRPAGRRPVLLVRGQVPGAEFQGVWARDHAAGQAYAEAHGIKVAHASYEGLCADPDVDIIYIASKTFDHHWQVR